MELDTHEHFPELHALVVLEHPHFIRFNSSAGASRVPREMMVGVSDELDSVSRTQPLWVGSRAGGSG